MSLFRKLNLSLIIGLLSVSSNFAQTTSPKLVVGVVVDQMRYDYLQRYWDSFGEEGFKRLVKQGFAVNNVNYHYKPTYTGPGHASIFAGAPPAKHGIVGNNWYSREEGKVVYCAESRKDDGSYWMAPSRMKGRNLADQIKLRYGAKAKCYGVSLKDRGAILPAGHMADAAFWFDGKAGLWISSEYYEKQNQAFLESFNKIDLLERYLRKPWQLSKEQDHYQTSFADSNAYEKPLVKKGGITFPYNLLEAYRKEGYKVLKSIPQGNTMTTDFAISLLKEEALGQDAVPDFLSISYSATDYVGHTFGVGSREVQDTYIKLDQDIANLLVKLDQEVGEGEYLLFLTSDHGAGEPRNFLKDAKLPNGRFSTRDIKNNLDSALDQKFGPRDWIDAFINLNVYFNTKALEEKSIKAQDVLEYAKRYLSKLKGVKAVWSASSKIAHSHFNSMVENGYEPEESGDLILLEQASWTSYSDKGSTHGSPYHYDTHVPLLFYGKGIKPGKTNQSYSIAAIASTVAHLIHLAEPELSKGEIIIELMD